MGSETELKFEVSPQDLKRLKSARVLRRRDGEPSKEENIVSVYFDTGKHKLRRKGISLRVRHSGDKRLQTIKTEGPAGPFSRGEWEHKIKGDAPDLRAARGSALAPLLTKKLKHALKPIFETRVRRTTVQLRRNGSRIEVALDQGQVRAGQKTAPINEVELELKRGKPAALFKQAQEIVELVSANLALKSKSERGYDLVAGKPARAVEAQKIKFPRGTSTVQAFRIIGHSALRHITANEPAVRAVDPEAVHQMRVGLRRLRAALSVFSKLLGDKQTARIKDDLNWMTGELGPARDLDVYIKSKIKPLRREAPAKRGLRDLLGALAARRAAAFKRAKDAVESPRYRALAFDTLRWLETGDWAKRSRARSVVRLERFAADTLTRRTKKARKKAKKLHQLNARQRHKLRIAIKKLRYASDFFASVFTGREAKRPLSDFKALLSELQDRLGALNDIAVHQKLATGLATGKGRAGRPTRAFAAGVASGREQSEIEPLLKSTAKAARKFTHMPPFWT